MIIKKKSNSKWSLPCLLVYHKMSKTEFENFRGLANGGDAEKEEFGVWTSGLPTGDF